MRITEALFLSAESCTVADCAYKNGPFCPKYWKRVFERFYGDAPNGKGDPRWDSLFKEGFPALRELTGG